MKLIYRDEAIKAINDVLTEDVRHRVWLKSRINNLKPVDAIPISFIQERINSLQELAEYEFEANGGYIGQVSFEKDALKNLLEAWEKENANK